MFSGKTAVITGGASGIGRATAELWVADGGHAVVCDINDEKGEAFQAEMPGKITFVHCDTTSRADLDHAADVASGLGQLYLWVNNAGGGGGIDSLDGFRAADHIDPLRKMVDLNVSAYIEGTAVALQAFEAVGEGVVICTASMAGLLPVGAPPVYSATKACNIQMVRALASALDMEGSGIKMYALCPSYTLTPATAANPNWKRNTEKMLGGVLAPEHMAQGFMLLTKEQPPNGSVMRVTLRKRGTLVVHDLMQYGKELGGEESQRPGIVMMEQMVEAAKL